MRYIRCVHRTKCLKTSTPGLHEVSSQIAAILTPSRGGCTHCFLPPTTTEILLPQDVSNSDSDSDEDLDELVLSVLEAQSLAKRRAATKTTPGSRGTGTAGGRCRRCRCRKQNARKRDNTLEISNISSKGQFIAQK